MSYWSDYARKIFRKTECFNCNFEQYVNTETWILNWSCVRCGIRMKKNGQL